MKSRQHSRSGMENPTQRKGAKARRPSGEKKSASLIRLDSSLITFPLRLGVLCGLTVWIAALMASAVSAQQGSFTPSGDIFYGEEISDRIDDERFFDSWRFFARANDIFLIRMTASEGLAPLIGVLNPGGNLLVSSGDTPPNGEATVRFTAPEEGFYLIIATRVGNENGDTVGAYTLRIDWINAPPTRDPAYQDVIFDCAGQSAATAVTLLLYPDPGVSLTIRAYGIDGFDPALAYRYRVSGESGCTTAPAPDGDVVIFPGSTPRTTSPDLPSAALTTPPSDNFSEVRIVLGGLNDAPGRFMLAITGLRINQTPPTDARGVPVPIDLDDLWIRMGPRVSASADEVAIYMIAADGARLDPFMRQFGQEEGCDDAGRRAAAGRNCEDVPAITGAGVALSDGLRYLADRFDAGQIIPPGDTQPYYYALTTLNRSTYGDYAVIILGELPPRR